MAHVFNEKEKEHIERMNGKIKKSPKRISISDSKWMRDNLHKDLNDYKITFKEFSLEDIVVFLSKH